MRFMSLRMPAMALSALSSSAAEAPRREEVLPVTTRPSGSTIAPAVASPDIHSSRISSAFCLAAATAGQRSGVTSACCMTSSSFLSWQASAMPRATSTCAV